MAGDKTTILPAGFDRLAGPSTMRLRGQIIYPAGLAAPAPLVVIAHGNPPPLPFTPAGAPATAPASITSDENFKGYTWLQQMLAARGYITLSVDLDDAYGAVDYGFPPF